MTPDCRKNHEMTDIYTFTICDKEHFRNMDKKQGNLVKRNMHTTLSVTQH